MSSPLSSRDGVSTWMSGREREREREVLLMKTHWVVSIDD